MTNVLNKKSVKLISIFLIFIVGAIFVWFTFYYMTPEARKNRETKEFLKEQKEKNKNDTYGSTTPRGTFDLYMKAVKTGDMELASKYFVIDKQKKMERKLKNLKKEYGLDRIEKVFKRLKLSKKTENKVFFTITDDKDKVKARAVLRKNSKGQWKMSEI